MYMKLVILVLCVTLFGGCFAAIGKSGGGLGRGLKPGGGKTSNDKSRRGPDSQVPGGGMGFGGGPGESDLSPGGEETIDIDSPDGGFAGFSGDNDDDEDRDGESGSGMQVTAEPCWQVKKDIMNRQVVGHFDPACTSDGFYKSRQCDHRRMCWCVERSGNGLTGKTPYKETTEEECDRIIGNGVETDKNILQAVKATPTPKPTEDISITDEVKNDIDQMGPGENDVKVETLGKPNPNGVESRKSEDEVEKADKSLLMGHPGILAGIIGGAVVGLLCAVLLVMFIVYRMRKKDEGSYALDEPRKSPTLHGYRPAKKKKVPTATLR